jgi:hypothetical protein
MCEIIIVLYTVLFKHATWELVVDQIKSYSGGHYIKRLLDFTRLHYENLFK